MTRYHVLIVILIFGIGLLMQCEKTSSTGPQIKAGPCVDVDGNEYETIVIGDQVWMAENLKVIHYQNGDSIELITENATWKETDTGAMCTYENNDTFIPVYGLLYNGYAVLDERGLAPKGWHVATDEDWKKLEMFLGMERASADSSGFRGIDEGGKIKSTDILWQDPNEGAIDEHDFSALPGGTRSYQDGAFFMEGQWAYFWTGTAMPAGRMASRRLGYLTTQIVRADDFRKGYGLSVRCVQD